MIADQTTDLVEYSARLGKHVLAQASDLQRKQYGQFLTPHEAIGLSAILNCSVVDRYFRIVNGNTQVNAEELWALPRPPLAVIHQIGQALENESQAGGERTLMLLSPRYCKGKGSFPWNFQSSGRRVPTATGT